MKRWFRIVVAGATLCVAACGEDDAAFGPLPRIVCRAMRSGSRDEAVTRSPASADRIFRQLLPRFGALRGRDIPFSNETDDYEVLEVRIETLRRSCDLVADVAARPAKEPVSAEGLRLYFLGVDEDGAPLARGIVFASSANDDGTWHGEATFHLLSEAGRYRDFDRMVFVPRERFHAAADSIRRR